MTNTLNDWAEFDMALRDLYGVDSEDIGVGGYDLVVHMTAGTSPEDTARIYGAEHGLTLLSTLTVSPVLRSIIKAAIARAERLTESLDSETADLNKPRGRSVARSRFADGHACTKITSAVIDGHNFVNAKRRADAKVLVDAVTRSRSPTRSDTKTTPQIWKRLDWSKPEAKPAHWFNIEIRGLYSSFQEATRQDLRRPKPSYYRPRISHENHLPPSHPHNLKYL